MSELDSWAGGEHSRLKSTCLQHQALNVWNLRVRNILQYNNKLRLMKCRLAKIPILLNPINPLFYLSQATKMHFFLNTISYSFG
jgi:hypothetical protein